MGSKLADLLRWRDKVELKDKNDNPIINKETNEPWVVYIRVIGDEDLKDVYQDARIASSQIRKNLRDPETKQYAEVVEPISVATKEECIELLIQARTQNLYAEAQSEVEREEEPELSEFAVDPDAPTLEEQEKHDLAKFEQTLAYQTKIQEYVSTRADVLRAELEGMDLEELRETAKKEVGDILAYEAFASAIISGKLSKACYMDKTYRELAFDTARDFLQTKEAIRQQLIAAYTNLELTSDEVKN